MARLFKEKHNGNPSTLKTVCKDHVPEEMGRNNPFRHKGFWIFNFTTTTTTTHNTLPWS